MEQPIGMAILHLLSDMDAGEEEFVRWCNDHHHAESLQREGFLSLRRFETQTPGAPRHLTIYELDDIEAAQRQPAAAATPMPAAVQGLRYERAVYRRLELPSPSQRIGDAVLERRSDTDERVNVASALSVRHFIEPSKPEGQRFLALYQVTAADALDHAGPVYRQTFPPRGWLTSKGVCP